MNFEQKVLQFIMDEGLIQQKDRLLIACSGGVDSMALLTFFERMKHHLEIEFMVAHVDHMLRGEESAQDRIFVEAFCEERGIACISTAIPIPEILAAQGGNSQAVCREHRYRFFNEMLQKHSLNKLVTAHHADDQLESILMALAKAGTVNGLQGIQVKRPFAKHFVIRPFLMVTKEEIRTYLQQKDGSFREDASNAKDDYTRNRFRHRIVPLLKQENENVAQHAVQFSLQLAQDDAYLQELTQQAFDRIVIKNGEHSYKVAINSFQKEPLALQRRLILILLNYLYNDKNLFQSQTLCTAILNFFKNQNGSAMMNLPEHFVVRREYGNMFFEKEQPNMPIPQQQLVLNDWNELIGVRVYIGETSQMAAPQSDQAQVYYFSAQTVSFPISIRARKQGDRMLLPGMERPKRVSRIFIDEKIPLAKRDECPLLVDVQQDVLAILGVRVSNKFSKHRRANDDYVLIIEQIAE
ncbi:tRNA lysidine(34) synthetase TilS [Lysinibacillus sp. 54212]|uniref:tRNA lysidine(34) synthetase TilS n=1 Tax=Lysinibacillus sp. 54212 TaxID=3119829 RepID=UPI002FCC13C3